MYVQIGYNNHTVVVLVQEDAVMVYGVLEAISALKSIMNGYQNAT
jgi:hypothetical protein